jgi:hypothetical protein
LFLEELATISEPLLALIELQLASFEAFEGPEDILVPTLPDSFLGGSVPRLRSLNLFGVSFPGIGKLLLSTRDLVTLTLQSIPPSGFISPAEMVAILSTLTRLKSFRLSFKTPQILTHGARERPPELSRVVLPALTNFYYYGDSKYLEGIVSRIHAPLIRIIVIFFNGLVVSDISPFRDFIRLTKIPDAAYRVNTSLSKPDSTIALFQQYGDKYVEVLNLNIPVPSNSLAQLSSLAQACSTFLLPLPNLEHFAIYTTDVFPFRWQGEVDNTLWMELLRPFITVKDLVLDELVVFVCCISFARARWRTGNSNFTSATKHFLRGFPAVGSSSGRYW